MKVSQNRKLAGALVCLALLSQAGGFAQQPRPQQQQQSQPPKPAPSQSTGQKRPQPTPPQEVGDDEVIKLNTDLVQLHAVVTDKKGQPVDNLTQDDFEVLEDGRPQQISFFSVSRVGGEETNAPPAARTAARRPPARTIVLFVDTLHMTTPSFTRARRALRQFIDQRVTDSDSVMVVATSGTLGILQQFMSDRRTLRYAVDKLFPFVKETTAYTPELAAAVVNGDEGAINAALAILKDEEGVMLPTDQAGVSYAQARGREILADEDNLRRATLETLSGVCEQLKTMKGQRIVAFVSDGFTSFDRGGTRDDLAFRQVVGRAARSGVVIYSLYAMGLVAAADRHTGVPQETAQNNLRDMAHETGGRAWINRNDIGLELKEMLEENRVYYSMAYYPPKGDDDKRYRKIEVRLKDPRGYTVRAQRGYVPAERRVEEAAASPREKLFKEMISPLPATNVGVTASASFLETAGDDAQVTLQIHVGGDRLEYEKEGDAFRLRCEVVSVVFDKDGKIADHSAETISALLTPAQIEEARRDGYRYTRRVRLAPGLYQVRVGVREVSSGLSGTSASWVEVPNLSKGKPTLSSIFLGKNQPDASAAAADAPKADHAARQKLLAAGATYKSGEPIFYRFVAYNTGGADRESAASVKVDIVREDDPVYEGSWQPLASRAVRRDAKGVEAGGQLRASLAPGLYTLRVTLKDASNKTQQQEIDFQIEQ
ncbi:MAG: VWA domain-containing protein [Acidobacteriota bacterium]|nr:VWA domain-containing protein [Acidobacteriota bacterium]